MARLFISSREIDFFNDIAREIQKDIIGQRIFYYPISFDKTTVHPVYEEAIEKIFENPIELSCLVDWNPVDVHTNRFGQDEIAKISVFCQDRDLIDKKVESKVGDFFSYGSQFFEITTARQITDIYGQVERNMGVELIGVQSRRDVFATKALGPTEEFYDDPDAVQETFVQQRGFAQNSEGITGDKRDLVDGGALEPPIVSEPAEVSPRGGDGKGSAFYGEDC